MSQSYGAQVAEGLVESSSRVSPRPTIRLDLVCTVPGRPAISSAMGLGDPSTSQRAVVARALADRLLEPLDGLDVVVEDVGAGLHDRPQRLVLAVEVGDEHLDAHARATRGAARGWSPRRCARRRRAGRRGRRWSPRRARGPSARTASATRRGSSSSFHVGRPVLTAQKPQARVQVSPRIMTVAVRCSQHSPMLGQRASSHTVLSERPRIRPLSSW